MIIKAGTYKWNDTLDLSTFPSTECEINFTIPPIQLKDLSTNQNVPIQSIDFNKLKVDGVELAYILFEDLGGGDSNTTTMRVYAEGAVNVGLDSNWDTTFFTIGFGLSLDMPFLLRYGQIISILEDAFVSEEWYNILSTNLTPHTSPEISEGTTTTTITYKGSPIITITNGVMVNEYGEPAAKAIIPTEDYKLDSNIELTITKS